MKENFQWGKKMEWENFNTMMEIFIWVFLKMIIFMEKLYYFLNFFLLNLLIYLGTIY